MAAGPLASPSTALELSFLRETNFSFNSLLTKNYSHTHNVELISSYAKQHYPNFHKEKSNSFLWIGKASEEFAPKVEMY